MEKNERKVNENELMTRQKCLDKMLIGNHGLSGTKNGQIILN